MHEYVGYLTEEYRAGRINRRTFLRWGATLGVSLPALSAILAACSAPSTPASPTAAASAAPAVSASPAARAAGSPAASGSPAAGTPRRGGTMRVTSGPTVTVDPHKLTSNGGIVAVYPVVNYLVDVSPTGTLVPELATSWTPSQDVKTWTFKLRPNVKFHDGSTLKADDVVATFKRLVDKTSGSTAVSALNFLTANDIEKVDDLTVAFHLSRALADFPYYAHVYQAAILPANWPGDWAKNPAGTGPFTLASYTVGQGSTYKRNPNYWEPNLPYLDGIEIKVWQDPSGEVSALEGGQSDLMTLTPYDVLPTIRKNPNLRIQSSRSSSYDAMHMRADMPPFNDARVRQALAFSLNRPNVLTSVLGAGDGDLATDSPVAPVFRDYVDIGPKPQDLAQAKQLLSAAGHASDLSFDLPTHTGAEWLKNYALALQQAFAGVDAKSTLKVETSQVYYAHWTTIPVGVTEWAHRGSASEILNSAYRTGVNWNASHWSNPTFDKTLDQLDATVDLTQRKQIMQKLEKTLTDEVPTIIAYHRTSPRAYSQRVQNLQPDPNRFLDLRSVWLSA